jgi:hypothetical protein
MQLWAFQGDVIFLFALLIKFRLEEQFDVEDRILSQNRVKPSDFCFHNVSR